MEAGARSTLGNTRVLFRPPGRTPPSGRGDRDRLPESTDPRRRVDEQIRRADSRTRSVQACGAARGRTTGILPAFGVPDTLPGRVPVGLGLGRGPEELRR